jgi:membrane protease YdiL (CAAX protease family)
MSHPVSAWSLPPVPDLDGRSEAGDAFERSSPAPLSRSLMELGLLSALLVFIHVVYLLVIGFPLSFVPRVLGRVMLGSSAQLIDLAFLAFLLVLSWALAFGVGRRYLDMSWRSCTGAALILYLYLRSFYFTLPDLKTVADTGSVAAAIPEAQLYRSVAAGTLRHIVLPLLGVLLFSGALTPHGLGAKVTRWRLRRGLAVAQLRFRAGPVRDVMHGFWLFITVAVTALIANFILVVVFPSTKTGEESAVFENMTPALDILLSLEAGIGEEIFYRGILLTFLLWAFRYHARKDTVGRVLAAASAILVQALFFGVAHAGYGNLQHVIMPFIFALGMGVIMLRFGLIPPIIIHVLIDVVAFAGDASRDAPWFLTFVYVLLYTIVLVTIGYYTWRLIVYILKGPQPPPATSAGPVSPPAPIKPFKKEGSSGPPRLLR